MDGPIRIVLLGAGRMGRAYFDTLLQLPDLAHVVAAADVAPSARYILETSITYLSPMRFRYGTS